MPEGEVKENLIPAEIPEGEEEKVEPQHPTVEELEALRTEIGKLNIGLARKETELKRLKEQAPKPSTAEKSRLQEILLAEMKTRASEEGVANPRIAMLEAEIQREKQRETVENYTKEWRNKITAKIEDAGLDPNDETLDGVWESFDVAYAVDGKFERADKRLDRILAKAKPKDEPKPEEKPVKKGYSEEDVEELKRKWMEEKGLLVTETGSPSASPDEWENLRMKYGEGTASRSETEKYLRMRRERGL